MDPVTITERVLERDRMNRELQDLEHQQIEEQKQHERDWMAHEIQVNSEHGWTKQWGDWISWVWILFFLLLSTGTAFLCYWLVGSGVQTHWHLGYPPTGPG